jgi:hypothetical protein
MEPSRFAPKDSFSNRQQTSSWIRSKKTIPLLCSSLCRIYASWHSMIGCKVLVSIQHMPFVMTQEDSKTIIKRLQRQKKALCSWRHRPKNVNMLSNIFLSGNCAAEKFQRWFVKWLVAWVMALKNEIECYNILPWMLMYLWMIEQSFIHVL